MSGPEYNYYDDLDVDYLRSNPTIYHGHPRAVPDQFMKSPILHVGTLQQANQIVKPVEHYLENNPRRRWRPNMRLPGVHKLSFSQFAEFHPHILSDSAVNTAQEIHLREMGAPISSSVVTTARSYDHEPDVKAALQAFRENKIVPYLNEFETPRDPYGNYDPFADDVENISYAVPAPSVNLIGPRRRRDPLTQPTLPMDLTDVVTSDKTKEWRDARDWHGKQRRRWKIEEINES